MALIDIRTKFIDLGGRNDLVVDTDDYVDNGADFFITSGQRLLEGLIDTPQTNAKYEKALTIGDTTLTFQNCRAIEEVWLSDTDDGVSILKEVSHNDILEAFPELSSEDEGTPAYYAVDVVRVIGTEGTESVKGIIFMPPTDTAYTMVIKGEFGLKLLSGDNDINYWTEKYPEILVMAALYMLEVFYRNTEGMRDWLASIMLSIDGIDKSVVAEEIAHITQIKG